MEQNTQEQYPAGYKWSVMIVIMMGVVMATLDSSIVNVSIPKIMSDFGANLDDIEWVLTGYMLAFAVSMPLTGWLRERIGYKAIYVGALVLFTTGSVLCGCAWNLPSLIMARIIQAIGGGAMQPTGMAMLTEVFPAKERGKAMGYFGVAIIFGPGDRANARRLPDGLFRMAFDIPCKSSHRHRNNNRSHGNNFKGRAAQA